MDKKKILIFSFTIVLSISFAATHNDNYGDIVLKIKDMVANDISVKNHAYETVAYMVDTFGPRLWGSQALEDAIDYMAAKLLEDGFQNIKKEPVTINNKWVRGEESITMNTPFVTKIPMIGLGKTAAGDVTEDIIMVETQEQLENAAVDAYKGKIVFINPKWTNYEGVYWSRVHGPALAAAKGADGCIIRSVGPISIENPHTGVTQYDKDGRQIPAAAVSLETADMWKRMLDRGQTVNVRLLTSGKLGDPGVSYNLIGEIVGSSLPNEIILMGGHIDSWDTGPQTGANDDAAGFMVCYSAMRTLIKLNLKPKRTIRFIAWSGEEFGEDTQGAKQYVTDHNAELNNHVVAFESDGGTTQLYGFGITGKKEAFTFVDNINKNFLAPLGSTITSTDGEMVDTGYLNEKKIPMMKNLVKDTEDASYYFTYHHSAGDSMNVLSGADLDSNVAAIAAMFYIIADNDNRLPRDF